MHPMRVLTPLCSAVLLAMACTSQAQAMNLTEAIQSTIATTRISPRVWTPNCRPMSK